MWRKSSPGHVISMLLLAALQITVSCSENGKAEPQTQPGIAGQMTGAIATTEMGGAPMTDASGPGGAHIGPDSEEPAAACLTCHIAPGVGHITPFNPADPSTSFAAYVDSQTCTMSRRAELLPHYQGTVKRASTIRASVWVPLRCPDYPGATGL